MISVIVKITSRDFFRDSVTVGPTLTCIARAPYVRLFINLSEKRSVRLRRYCYYLYQAMFYTHALFQSLSGGLLNDTGGLLTLYIMINSLVPLWKVSYIFSSFYNNHGLLHKMIPFFWWNFDNNFHFAQVPIFLFGFLVVYRREKNWSGENCERNQKSVLFFRLCLSIILLSWLLSDCQFNNFSQENTLVHL